MLKVVNPYSHADFFNFFGILFQRFWLFFSGKLSFENLVSDEIQIIVLMTISISAALVGTFLVLRKMTMLANALSHTILLGIVLAYLISSSLFSSKDPYQMLSVPVLMIAAVLCGILTTFLTELFTRLLKLQEDASIGLIFTSLFALGIVLVTLFSRNVHIGVELVMGNVDALQKEDVKSSLFILAFNAALFLLFFNGFKITSFDSALAKSFGLSPLFFNYLLMVQTSFTAIASFKAVGVLMILAFIVMPPLIARLYCHSLSKLIYMAILIGVGSSIIGVALSRHILSFYGIGLSTGGIVVTLMGFLYLILALFSLKKGFVGKRVMSLFNKGG